MHSFRFAGLARIGRALGAHCVAPILLAAFTVGGLALARAEDSKPAAPPESPSPGKALVYIYRPGRFEGNAAHDHLYLNGIYWAYLKNGEYAFMEVGPGTVIVTGAPEMYYAGGIAMSAYAGTKDATKKEHERIRLQAEADKTYYLKWSSGTMATGIKVVLMDPGTGAKEMSKLHLSAPVEQSGNKKPQQEK